VKRYVIERDIPGVGGLMAEQRAATAAKSNAALAKLGGKAQWVHSYIADDKTFCTYLADSEERVREHARVSGFPAINITEVRGIIDPLTSGAR